MKPVWGLIIFFAVVMDCYPMARYTGKEEMIRNCDYIVVARIERVEPANRQSRFFRYSEKAIATVEQSLKGDLAGQIEIFGGEDFICAQNEYEPGRFLLFLQNNRDFLTGANWHLGVRPIRGKNVDWYVEGKGVFTREPVPLDNVLKYIRTRLELEETLADNSAWKCLSCDGTRFETSWSSKLHESEFIELKKMDCLSKVREVIFWRPEPIINSIFPFFKDSPIESIYFFEGDITAEALSETLEHLPQLKKLSLDQVKCEDDFLVYIISPHLKELDIACATVSEDHIHALTNLTELCRLQLPQSFSNESYVYLKLLEKLTDLTLCGDHIDSNAIRCIQNLPLNQLRIYGDVSDELMELLIEIPSIRDLEISSHRITDKGVKILASLTGLTRLDVGSRGITDKSIAFINELSQLTRLSLHGSNISDDGLSGLTNLTMLKSISVRDTQVTEQGVVEFKKRYPEVSVTQ